ncbi:MAG: hypothetical protein H6581_31575 [Bacteroidia bacterium]|nr:hypothetical protein [Bacteroidia bacterium]
MDKVDPLFSLVASLNQRAKLAFKSFVQSTVLQKEVNDIEYWKLYQDIQDELKKGVWTNVNLRSKFSHLSNLSRTKGQLFDRIIGSLISNSDNPRSLLEKELQGIREMIRIGQKPSEIKLAKLAQQAIDSEYFDIAIRIYHLRSRAWVDFEDLERVSGEITQINMDVSLFNLKQSEIHVYQNLYDTSYLTLREFYAARGSIELKLIDPILKHPMLADHKKAECYTSQLYYHILRYSCWFFLGKYKESECEVKAAIEIFDAHSHLITEYTALYVDSLTNYGLILVLNKKQEEANKILKRVSTIKTRSQRIEARVWRGLVVGQMATLLYLGEAQKAIHLIKDVERGLVQFDKNLRLEDKLLAQFSLAIVLFTNQNLRQAKIWLNQITEVKNTKVRVDLQNMARILLMCVYYEMGEFSLLTRQIREMERWNGRRIFEFETRMMSFFRKAPFPEAEKARITSEFTEEIEALLTDPFEQRVKLYFDPIAWLKATN